MAVMQQSTTNNNYLDSLSTSRVHKQYDLSFESSVAKVKEGAKFEELKTVAENTPDDHYAKENPGAGWAGYKHPMFGGYLNRLNQNNLEEGKKADYGDDIRWGAQVYLDNI